jgi:hypothetical protein
LHVRTSRRLEEDRRRDAEKTAEKRRGNEDKAVAHAVAQVLKAVFGNISQRQARQHHHRRRRRRAAVQRRLRRVLRDIGHSRVGAAGEAARDVLERVPHATTSRRAAAAAAQRARARR